MATFRENIDRCVLKTNRQILRANTLFVSLVLCRTSSSVGDITI